MADGAGVGQLKPTMGVRVGLCAATFCLLAFAHARYSPDIFKVLGLAQWGYAAIIALAALPFLFGGLLFWASGIRSTAPSNGRFAVTFGWVALSVMAFLYSLFVLDGCVGWRTCL